MGMASRGFMRQRTRAPVDLAQVDGIRTGQASDE